MIFSLLDRIMISLEMSKNLIPSVLKKLRHAGLYQSSERNLSGVWSRQTADSREESDTTTNSSTCQARFFEPLSETLTSREALIL